MSDHLKYVIVSSQGLELPIIFPAILDHSMVCLGYTPISAGNVKITAYQNDEYEVNCFGGSTTLQLKSRREDEQIIKTELERPYQY